MQPFEVIHVILQQRSVNCLSVDQRRHVHAKGKITLQRTGVTLWGYEPPLLGGLPFSNGMITPMCIPYKAYLFMQEKLDNSWNELL